MVKAVVVRRLVCPSLLVACATLVTLTASNASAAGPAVGVISTLAGTGVGGFNGDLSLATSSQINLPAAVAVDAAGNVYIADTNNNRVRKVTASTGVISAVAGTGVAGFLGDGGLATAARLNDPSGVAVDASGNVYIADQSNHRIRRVAAGSGIITTVAGSGTAQFGGDGGLATAAQLYYPYGVAVDASGNLYIADRYNQRIRRVSVSNGVITTVAGDGGSTYSGDGLATGVSLNYPTGVAVDGAGNVYIADYNNHRVRRVTAATGLLSTVAGTGAAGYLGENVPATGARLYYPVGIGVDSGGNVYVSDQYTNRIRKVTVTTGLIATVAGSGTEAFGGDGGEATAAQLREPHGVALDAAGNLYIADTVNQRIRKVATPIQTRAIATVAGTGTSTYNGDGPATGAALNYPTGVAVDGSGNVYIADSNNHRIRKVAASTGIISTVAGTGSAGYLGENGPATAARLYYPTGVALDGSGNIYIADQYNNRIRRVSATTGIITTVAGSGTEGFLGDGGAATAAQLDSPYGLAIDVGGNIYIADSGNNRVRKVAAGSGIITTAAGNGIAGVGGDGGAAPSAQLSNPIGVAVDGAGNIYIADYYNHRIRKVTAATGLISTYAGTASSGYGGEAGPATFAPLRYPTGIASDAAGNVYIADQDNQRIRMVSAGTGIISTVAGNGTGAFGGDGGAATAASLYQPYGVAVAPGGSVYVADTFNHRVRKASLPLAEPTNVTARWLSASAIRVTWTPAAGATSYTLRRGTTSGGETVIATGVGGTLFDDPGRTPGVTYYYIVTSGGGGAESPYSNEAVIRFSVPGVAGDFDADGRTDLTVFRPSTSQWFVRYSAKSFDAAAYGAYTWGSPGDLPIVGDVDGDHVADLTVYRPASGQWLIRYSSQGYNEATPGVYQWGLPADVPIAADFDGDGRLDLTVYRPSSGQWFIRYSSQGYSTATSGVYQWGIVGDVPLATDFDKDGRTDLAVYRPSTGQWFVRYSTLNYNPGGAGTYQWGLVGDVPLAGDFDGDGRTDLTVYRPATNQWLITYSTLNYNAGGAGIYQWGLPGDLPVVLDLDGDGRTDLTVFRPTTGEWVARYSSLGYNPGGATTYQWGLPGDVALPRPVADVATHDGDVDGDGKADLTVYRPSNGSWYVSTSRNGYSPANYLAFQWGLNGDVPLSRDFDGDRLPDIAVYRPSTGEWFIRYSTLGYSTAGAGYFQWGLPGDVPVAGDVDGDGKAEVMVFRPSSGQWFIRYSAQGYSTASYAVYQWGLPGDTPIAADFNGDGKAELSVYRPSSGQWFLLSSTNGYNPAAYSVYQVGLAGDIPLAGDFDGDGRSELTVYRPTTGHWLIRYSSQAFGAATAGDFQWGVPGDIPVIRDFDGDGLADLTVFRPSTAQWFVRYSSRGGAAGVFQWGLLGDLPVPQP